MAIGLSLAHADIGPEHAVLLPAYHCPSMVIPVVWRGAKPVFYKVNGDTSVDLEDVESKLTKTTRVLVVPHFFGFPQDATRIREFCDQHRLIYLEDCAHAFFGSHADRPLGSFGDYAIASPWKFFPTFDGGILISGRLNMDDVHLNSPGAYFHLKAALNALEYSFEYDRLSTLKGLMALPLRAKAYLWRKMKDTQSGAISSHTFPVDSDFPLFDPDWVYKGMSLPTRLALAIAPLNWIAAARRLNYRRLDDALRGLRGCRALFSSLPNEVVPQVFPLLVDDPLRVFPRLKHAGVPIIRFGEFLWPGVDDKTCAQSVDLSRRVFQFPCHQDLRPEELDWMIGAIRSAFDPAE